MWQEHQIDEQYSGKEIQKQAQIEEFHIKDSVSNNREEINHLIINIIKNDWYFGDMIKFLMHTL